THLLEVKDPILPEIEIIEGTNLFLITLNPFETITLTYTVKFHNIGIFRFDEVYFRHRDFLGLRVNEFRLSQTKLHSLQRYIQVVPRLEKLETLALKNEWMALYGGYFQSKHVGQDSDFRGIRDYQYGDTLNRVNWRATARKIKLMSNEYNWDKAIHAEVILDASETAAPIWVNSLRATISLVEFLLRMRNSVGFSIINEFPEYIDSRIGKKQLLHITNKIVQLKTGKIHEKDILLRRLQVISMKYDPKATIILISPFTFDATFEFAQYLRNKNYNVLAIIPLSLEKQSKNIVMERDYIRNFPLLHEMVKTEILLDRIKIRNSLKKMNIPYIEWDTNVHFGSAMEHIRRL
ncbi:MAG: DUF58 domain-containing protein, partial [Candidatus Thorarchaeota archaeon]